MIPPNNPDTERLKEYFFDCYRAVTGRCPWGNRWTQEQVRSWNSFKKAEKIVREHFKNPENPEHEKYEIEQIREKCGLFRFYGMEIRIRRLADSKLFVHEIGAIGQCCPPEGEQGPCTLWRLDGLLGEEFNIEEEIYRNTK